MQIGKACEIRCVARVSPDQDAVGLKDELEIGRNEVEHQEQVGSTNGGLVTADAHLPEPLLACDTGEVVGNLLGRIELALGLRLGNLAPGPAEGAAETAAHAVSCSDAAIERRGTEPVVLSLAVFADDFGHLSGFL